MSPKGQLNGAEKEMSGVGITEIVVLLIVGVLTFDLRWLSYTEKKISRARRKIQGILPGLSIQGINSSEFLPSNAITHPPPNVDRGFLGPHTGKQIYVENLSSNRPHDHTPRSTISGPAPPAPDDVPGNQLSESHKKESNLSIATHWNEFLGYLKDDILHICKAPFRWKSQDWMSRGGIAGAIAISSSLDGHVRSLVRANQFDRSKIFRTYIQPFGRSQTQLGVIAAILAAGRMKKKPEWMDTGFLCLEALVLTGCIVLPLKGVLGRKRPRDTENAFKFELFGLENSSFPSGDTTSVFAMATVIAGRFRSFWIRWAAYTIGVLVAIGRIYRSRHWLSDTLAGIAFGQTIGNYVLVRHNNRKKED